MPDTKTLPTLTTFTAADGSTLKVATRIIEGGVLRVDVYRAEDKNHPICSSDTIAKVKP